MKIVDNRVASAEYFEKVPLGEVFEHEERIYLKVKSEHPYAVDLSNGLLVEFEPDEGVRVLNTELNIMPG